MLKLIIVSAIIFVLAVVMTMAGRGGGNFYVLTLVLVGMPMHQAATTGQFILFMTAFAAMFIFQKHKKVSWALALFIGPLTALTALAGGYLSHQFSGFALKLVFSGMLALAGGLMLFPINEKEANLSLKKHGFWRLKSAEST